MHTAFLFPGQGSQSANFLHALPDHEAVRDVFDEAKRVLGADPRDLDSEAALKSTVAVQISVLIAAVAYSRLLAAEGARPDAVAGLSSGAFAAAVVSGSLAFADALRLIRLRSEAMEHACGEGYGMIAILGLREAAVRTLVDRVAGPAMPLYVASINAPDEIILAGGESALLAAADVGQQIGAKVRRLCVSVPSHGPLLDGVSVQLREAIRGIQFKQPSVPYISNHRARAAYSEQDIAEDLIVNVSRMVHWYESTRLLYELGCRLFVEVPPGRALSNLAAREFPDAKVLAAADIDFHSVLHVLRLTARTETS
jgi:malonate decarboxylase epsilon subunit